MAKKYDATKEMTGWNNTGFNDKSWQQPEIDAGAAGRLTAQMNEPIKIMKTIKPVGITQLKPGVFILDMGRNMVGRLHHAGKSRQRPAGNIALWRKACSPMANCMYATCATQK